MKEFRRHLFGNPNNYLESCRASEDWLIERSLDLLFCTSSVKNIELGSLKKDVNWPLKGVEKIEMCIYLRDCI